jgi:hypothetical protein
MRARSPRPSPHIYGGQAVYGLDVAHAHADRARHRRRLWNQAVTVAAAIVVAVGIVAGIWIGYEVYLEHTKDAQIEHQLGVEEQARRNAKRTVVDVIEELQQEPTFNGPGAPVFGLGPGTTEP